MNSDDVLSKFNFDLIQTVNNIDYIVFFYTNNTSLKQISILKDIKQCFDIDIDFFIYTLQKYNGTILCYDDDYDMYKNHGIPCFKNQEDYKRFVIEFMQDLIIMKKISN